MSISKDRGISSRLGTGGADISSGTLKTALAGLNNLNMNSKIKNAAKANGMENAATALRMQYGFGDEKQLKQLDEILSGETKLAKGTGHGDAQTVKENGQKTVYLNNYKGDMTREVLVPGDFDHSVADEKSQKVTRENDPKISSYTLIIRFPEDCQKQFLLFL